MSSVIPFPALVSIPLHDAVAEPRRRHRPLIAAAGQWALSRGVPLPADHIALWAATAQAGGYPGDVGGVTGPWRASHICGLLETVAAWCALAGCCPPAEIAESLWHLYGFLAASERLHPDSDAVQELRAAAVVFANFDCARPIFRPPPEPSAA